MYNGYTYELSEMQRTINRLKTAMDIYEAATSGPGDTWKKMAVDDLLKMRKQARRLGYLQEAQDITDELAARGYVDVPRLCSCFEIAGDNPACPVHGGQHA